jgi:hypothetical protein
MVHPKPNGISVMAFKLMGVFGITMVDTKFQKAKMIPTLSKATILNYVITWRDLPGNLVVFRVVQTLCNVP